MAAARGTDDDGADGSVEAATVSSARQHTDLHRSLTPSYLPKLGLF
jgi:hypothetical protein